MINFAMINFATIISGKYLASLIFANLKFYVNCVSEAEILYYFCEFFSKLAIYINQLFIQNTNSERH